MSEEINSPYETEPVKKNHLQFQAVLGAGFIAGLVLMIVPRASPWSALTFAAPVIMGRVIPEEWGMPVLLTKALHLVLSVAYGFLISLVVMRITQLRAVLAGAAAGLVLYALNYGAIIAWFPQLRGDEATVIFSHLVFGGIAGGAYRGLLKRRVDSAPEDI